MSLLKDFMESRIDCKFQSQQEKDEFYKIMQEWGFDCRDVMSDNSDRVYCLNIYKKVENDIIPGYICHTYKEIFKEEY